MCTASTYKNNYFGRNLDYDFSYGEEIVIIPRNFPLDFREADTLDSHYAMIGVAYVAPNPAHASNTDIPADYPLLYDAVNEKGLGVAGLNFVGNAVYNPHVDGKDNISQFEFIPWILGQCANLTEAKTLLNKLNFRNINFSDQLPVAELHWIIADQTSSIVVESVKDGLKIYDNPVGVLANNPPFDKQLLQLSNYQHLSAKSPVNTLAPEINFPLYSRGMGGIGLPGDLSSESRFAKAAFTKLNSLSSDNELSNVSQFFHILHSVDQQRGCADLGDNKYEITIYSDCYNLETGAFYYTCYDNHQITSVSLRNANLDGNDLTRYPFITEEQINYQK